MREDERGRRGLRESRAGEAGNGVNCRNLRQAALRNETVPHSSGRLGRTKTSRKASSK